MTSLHWLLLAVVIVVVGAGYLYLRRQSGTDPWQGMDEAYGNSDEDMERGVSLDGDSYVGEVRTIAPEDAVAGPPQDDAAKGSRPADQTQAQSSPAPQTGTGEPVPTAGDHRRTAEQPEPSSPSTSARVENIRAVQPPPGEEQIFQLHVAAPEGQAFDGPDIHAALDAEGLKFGLHDLYHRVTDANGEIQSVYCVANMLNPGVLDPVDQDHLRTPGLAMFLVLPGAIEGGRAMRDMMETANGIAQRLGGQVLDDQRSLLKAQTAQYMLDQIAEIDRRSRLREAR